MFRVKPPPLGTKTKVVILVPIRHGNRMNVQIEWRPIRQRWDVIISDPTLNPMSMRMAQAKKYQSDNLFDAAAFAASQLNPK